MASLPKVKVLYNEEQLSAYFLFSSPAQAKEASRQVDKQIVLARRMLATESPARAAISFRNFISLRLANVRNLHEQDPRTLGVSAKCENPLGAPIRSAQELIMTIGEFLGVEIRERKSITLLLR